MTANELMIRQNFLNKVLLKDGDNELSKDLKVKIMRLRIKLSKVRKEFDEDVQEAAKGFMPEGFQQLAQKQDKTEEEQKLFNEQSAKLNDEYNAYVLKRSQETVDSIIDTKFTDAEYNEILEVNAGNDVEINGQKLSAPDFLEVFYSLFVEE
jgi:hypothetical protein